MRHTGLGSPDDYVFLVDGVERGRCYLHMAPTGALSGPQFVPRWHWTIYGVGAGGDEDTLEKAQEGFKKRMESRK